MNQQKILFNKEKFISHANKYLEAGHFISSYFEDIKGDRDKQIQKAIDSGFSKIKEYPDSSKEGEREVDLFGKNPNILFSFEGFSFDENKHIISDGHVVKIVEFSYCQRAQEDIYDIFLNDNQIKKIINSL